MPHYQVSASRLIAAPAEKIYNLIADYQNGHPRIVPKPPFVSLTVEQGGLGAGTVISFQLRMLGQLQTFHATISEPEPGRVLVETNDNGVVTTFTVDPREQGRQAYVTITTTGPARDGFAGKIEAWLTPWLLRPVYAKELDQLAAVADE